MKIIINPECKACSEILRLAEAQARYPLHDPLVWEESEHWENAVRVLCYSSHGSFLSMFTLEPRSDIARCLFSGFPFLTTTILPSAREIEEFLHQACEVLQRSVYFPLVYGETDCARSLSRSCAARWFRLASPIIRHEALEKGLVQRAANRIGRRAWRRIEKFTRSGGIVRTLSGVGVMNVIKEIEDRSWKYALKQDMFTRGQAPIYQALSTSSHTLVRFAFVNDLPIAYRFDYRATRVVYVMKWSYCEFARNLSPGFFLLTQDLAECWLNSSLEYIDLYGSPDNLKSSVCELGEDRSRLDFAWSASEGAMDHLKAERQAHDARALLAWQANKSIRSLYG